MATLGEIEKLVSDYEKKIEKLKYLENVLKDLDVKGFEKEASEIKKHLKDPKSLGKCEEQIRKLKNQIEERKKIKKVDNEKPKEKIVDEIDKEIQKRKEEIPPQPKPYPRFSQHFPYELTPYYSEPGLIGKGGFARVFRVNRKKDGR